MITLYELHWSHYCEKVRLALDYMGLPWCAVDIDAFSKSELQHHPRPAHLPNRTVPALHDARTGAMVMDSTPILRYLAHAYPQAPALFPGNAVQQAAIDARLLEFDTLLAIPARRLGYTQVILECPDLLADLFLSRRANGFFCRPGVRRLSGAFVGMLLSKRFDFHRSEATGLYEALEAYLLRLTAELDGREFVVGDVLSAADLTLAAHLRPLTIVPYFHDHPALQALFARHRGVLAHHGGETDSAYQVAIAEARKTHAPMRRRLREHTAALPFAATATLAANDQRELWNWAMAAMPFHYLYSLRRRKLRQLLASALVR